MFTKVTIGIIIGLSSVLYATPFKLNSNGISHIYFPINDNKSKWYIASGSPVHKGSDTYADDWNLKNGYTAGIELSSSCDRDRGAEIISSFTGKIILADKYNNIGAYGKEVIIQSTEDSSFAIRYAHLDNVYVTDGIVKVGDVIGTVGDSGTDCAHLHLVLYKNLDTTALNRLKKGNSPKSLTGSADKYAAKFYSDATSGGNTNSDISNDNSDKPIITGVGSIINPEINSSIEYRYGSDRDEAIMQDHQNRNIGMVLIEMKQLCKTIKIVLQQLFFNGDI